MRPNRNTRGAFAGASLIFTSLAQAWPILPAPRPAPFLVRHFETILEPELRIQPGHAERQADDAAATIGVLGSLRFDAAGEVRNSGVSNELKQQAGLEDFARFLEGRLGLVISRHARAR